MKIFPAIGASLWYYPGGAEQLEAGEQPRAATVAYVYNDHCVNIGFLNVNGQHRNATSVRLLQPGEAVTEAGFCVFTPPCLAHAYVVPPSPISADAF